MFGVWAEGSRRKGLHVETRQESRMMQRWEKEEIGYERNRGHRGRWLLGDLVTALHVFMRFRSAASGVLW